MDIFSIDGPCQLKGTVRISGSKNAALPIIASTILAQGKSVIKDVPNLSDIRVLAQLLDSLGAKTARAENGDLEVDATVIDNYVGEYDIVRKMRASICVLGPLLARHGRAEVSMPGGCAIGDRPVDIHLRGLRELGAEIAESLRENILKGEVRLNLVAGVKNDVYRYYQAVLKDMGLLDKKKVQVSIIFAETKFDYFKKFNKVLDETDILWTKPSELSFYAGLGLPIILAPNLLERNLQVQIY